MEGIYITIVSEGQEVIVDEAMFKANRATIMDSLVSGIRSAYHRAKDTFVSPIVLKKKIEKINLQTNLKGGIQFNQDGQVVFTNSNFEKAIKEIATYVSSLVLTYHDNEAFFQILSMDEFKILFIFIAANQEATDRLAKALFEFFDVIWRKSTKTPFINLETRESLIELVKHMKIGQPFDMRYFALYNADGQLEDLKGIIYPCGKEVSIQK